jgi:hypothetical protein
MKIILIGFNKCGTRSFHDFFLKNKLSSIHHGKRDFARRVFANVEAGRPPFEDYDQYTCYSDIEAVSDVTKMDEILLANKLFKEFDQAYPDALFIYNVRDFDNWVISRFNHKYGRYTKKYLLKLRHKSQDANFGLNDLVETWRSDWFTHQRAVREYFADSPRFLEFDIEKDPVDKLVTFLEG